MKNLTRILSIVLAMVFVLALFAGCGDGSQESTEAPEEQTEAPATEAPSQGDSENEAAEPTDEPESTEVQLPICEEATYFTHWGAVAPYAASLISDPANDQAIYKLIGEKTNIYFDFMTTPAQEEANNFAIIISSGEYPQVMENAVSCYTTGADGAIDDEVLIDLKDLLAEYAPNYMEVLNADPANVVAVTSDEGRMAGIARFYKETGMENTGLLIRQDWLDELDLPTPRTYDDFYNTLTAFHTTYGGGAMALSVYGGDVLVGAGFGISTNFAQGQNGYEYPFYVVDGNVKFGFTQDEFLDYLTTMNKWYSEGLIYEDFYTLKGAGIGNDYALATEGTLGIAQGGANNIVSLRSLLDEGDPLNMVSLASPVMNESDKCVHIGTEATYVRSTNSWCLSTSCSEEDAVTLIKLVNYLFTEEGNDLTNYGEEGVTSIKNADGTYSWTELVTANPDGLAFQTAVHLYASSVGTQIPQVFDIRSVYYSFGEDDWKNIETLKASSDNAWNYPSYAAMNAEETEQFNSVMNDMTTLMQESIVAFITGEKPLSEFDAFRDQLVSMGIDDVIAIKQTAYDRYSAKLAEAQAA